MKHSSFISLIFVFSLLVILSLGCSFISNQTSEDKSLRQPKTVPSSPVKTNAQDNEDHIAGNYKASGINVDGKGTYEADLTITKRGEVYQFSWNSGNESYDGVGVKINNSVSVSYTNGANGNGCGVVLYEVFADGSLDGRAGYWGVDQSETEKAVRIKGTSVAGDYDVTGRNTAGKEYKTRLSIKNSGSGLDFNWEGANQLQGFGIQQDNMLTAGFGGKQCAFVAYEIKSDGSLEGKWGGFGNTSLEPKTP